jgi:hypothetical protein
LVRKLIMNGMNRVSKVAFMVSLLVASTSSVYAMDWQAQAQEEAEELERSLMAIKIVESREAAARQKAVEVKDKDFARAMAESRRIAQEKKEVEEVEQIAKNLGLLAPQPQEAIVDPVAPVNLQHPNMDDWSAQAIEAYFNLQNPVAPANPQVFKEDEDAILQAALAESERFAKAREEIEQAAKKLGLLAPQPQIMHDPAARVNLQHPNMDDWSAAYFNAQNPVAPANPQVFNEEDEVMARAIAESQRFDTERQKREEALQRLSLQMYPVDQQVPAYVPAAPVNLQGPNMDAWSPEDIETYFRLQELGIGYDLNGDITLAQWKSILSEPANTNQNQRPHINPGPVVPENLGYQLRADHLPQAWLGVDSPIGRGMGDVMKAHEKKMVRDQEWQVLRDGSEKNEHLLNGLLAQDSKEKVAEVKKEDVEEEQEKAQAQLQAQRLARLQELEDKKKQQAQEAAAHQDGLQDFSVAGIVAKFSKDK